MAAMFFYRFPFLPTAFPFLVLVGFILFGNIGVSGQHEGGNHVYIPTHITAEHSCNKGDWSAWSQCTNQCGENGTQYRKRYNNYHCPHHVESAYRQCNRRCYNGGELAEDYSGACECPDNFDGDCCETYDDSVAVTAFSCYSCDEAYSKEATCVESPASLPTVSCNTTCFVELTLDEHLTDVATHIKRGCKSASEVGAEPCVPQRCPNPSAHPYHSVTDNGTCALCCTSDLCNHGLPASTAAEVTYNIVSAGLMLGIAILLK
ncbi:Hypp8602 [Branchiostoma lanceolatum]|uniref:Hypp8602 protein n=1 Tax=Branchiostoma lanceolatum TaxID=7740 RepID=A0A8J9Z8P8_BRALA|nr:Hypp8602 [Branchiostoma lanceolatum]